MAKRRCLECGAATRPGAPPQWYRHPLTGAEWLCVGCHHRIYYRLKRQRVLQEADAASEGTQEAGAPEQQQKQKQQQQQQQPGVTVAAVDAAARRQHRHARSQRPPAAPPQAAVQEPAGPALLGLLEQVMGMAAAAASGLTPDLVAAFAALTPLDAVRVSLGAAWAACFPGCAQRLLMSC